MHYYKIIHVLWKFYFYMLQNKHYVAIFLSSMKDMFYLWTVLFMCSLSFSVEQNFLITNILYIHAHIFQSIKTWSLFDRIEFTGSRNSGWFWREIFFYQYKNTSQRKAKTVYFQMVLLARVCPFLFSLWYGIVSKFHCFETLNLIKQRESFETF